MRQQLGDELTAFLRAMEEPPVRGIRLNQLKPSEAMERYSLAQRIPWTRAAYILP